MCIRTGARVGQPSWKGKEFILVTNNVYRQENRKIEVCRVSGGGGTHGGFLDPGASSFINSSYCDT